jgi:hypothetical protein
LGTNKRYQKRRPEYRVNHSRNRISETGISVKEIPDWVFQVILVVIFLGAPVPAETREFQKPREVMSPGLMVLWDDRFFPGLHWEFSLHQHVLSGSPHDDFNIQSIGAIPVYHHPEGFTLGFFYGTFLVTGPVAADEDAASVAEWWMNGMQFEYGVVAELGRATMEYSRRSHHAIRPGYREAAADILRIGYGWDLSASSIRVFPHIRAGYIDLYEFWDSGIPRPRQEFTLAPTVFLRAPVSSYLEVVSRVETTMIALRGGGFDYDLYLEAGLGMVRTGGECVAGLSMFRTGDTEFVGGEKNPVILTGLFFRCAGRSGQRTAPVQHIRPTPDS